MNRTIFSPCRLGVFCLLTLLSLCAEGQLTITPTTTLSAETSNNTSTSATFRAQTNGNAGAGNVSKSSIRNLLYPGSTARIYAAVMPWFGRTDHMAIGYTSSDPTQISRQISDMRSRGIQGAIIPWYGPDVTINSAMAINFMQAAQSSGNFEFSIMIDVGALLAYAQQNGCDTTTQLITHLNYIASTFYGSSAYSRVSGRPLLYLFGVESYYINWSKVRSSVAGNPMFMVRNQGAFSNTNADAAYSWVEIDLTNANDMMLSYLDSFYAAAQSSSKYTFGSGYKGFNDTLAAWGSNRIINQQCGLTWVDTFAQVGKYYSSSHQLPAIQVATWNDYEEGTEIESGVDNCVVLSPVVTGSTLSWSIGSKASESTIDYYKVFISTDGQNLMKLASIAAGTHSLNLSQYNLAPRAYVLYVKAFGKASVVNHMSPPVSFSPSDQAPVASLSLSPASGPEPLTVTASSASSHDPDGSITAVKVDFGDGTVVSGGAGFAPSHIYRTSGTYTVTLTVQDNGGIFSTSQKTVNVAAGPAVTIASPAPGATLKSPLHLVATGNIAGGVSYMEVLVDGVPPPVYITPGPRIDTFLQIYAGTHTLRVVAHDTTPAANYIYSDVTITTGANDAAPSAVLTVKPSGGGNQVLACTATSTDSDGFIIGSIVNFGDGATAYGPTAFHTYASAGTYHVAATVTDNVGLTSTTYSTVTVGGTGAISGRVTSAVDGHALAGARVSAGSAATTTDSNGNYSLSSLPAATYTLTASSPGWLSATASVNVTAGSKLTQNFRLSTSGVLQGKVTSSSGSGIGGAKITFTGGVFNTTNSVTTDANGNYNAGWIPVGSYVISATASGVTKSSSASISAGVTTTVNFKF
jgi:PKD repeat protein